MEMEPTTEKMDVEQMMQLLKAIQEMMEPTEQKGKACTRR
jgi:hypothetical protein